MKKFLSLLLAAMMLLSCTVAMAEDNMTNKVSSDDAPFLHEASGTDYSAAKSASQSTDVWLQVEATGQIDVTVPLVAVFKTNIDGGSSVINEKYEIINHSSANVAVTKVEITDHQNTITNNGKNVNMKMVAKLPDAGSTVYDQYVLRFQPEDHYAKDSIWNKQKDGFDQDGMQNVASTESASNSTITIFDKSADGKVYTLDNREDNGGRGTEEAGLWLIERYGTIKTGNVEEPIDNKSYVKMQLETSPLSFVTKKGYGITDEYGVHLFTVEYTVKIDNSNPVNTKIENSEIAGTDFTDNNTETDFSYNYLDMNPDFK